MPMQIIQGTWEEIEKRKSEFAGHELCLIVESSPAIDAADSRQRVESKPVRKKLLGYGAFKHLPLSSEQFMIDKQAEIDLEDRRC